MTESEKFIQIQQFFKDNFTEAEEIDVDTMLFLIGVQEVGMGKQNYKKDDKLNLIHVAVCKLLEPFGYYRFDGMDKDNWPVYELIEELPNLQPNEQKLLVKKAIIHYFESEQLLDFTTENEFAEE